MPTDRKQVCFSAHRLALISAVVVVTACTSFGCQKSDSGAPVVIDDPRSQQGATGLSSENKRSVNTSDSANDVDRNRNSSPSVRLTAGNVTALKPNEILSRMIQAYRTATSYADAGQLRITIEREGQAAPDPEPLNASVTFVRPNQTRVQWLDAILVADGKTLHASVGSVPDQVLEMDAPPKLAIGSLFLGDAFYDSLAQGIAGFPIQLALLLDPEPLAAVLPEGSVTSTLPPVDFDGHACHRVKIDTSYGPRVYWIDAESYVLRMVELPSEGLRQQIAATQGPVKRVAVTLELQGARLNGNVPDAAFQFESPAAAKIVKQLIRPPHEISKLLGKQIPDFKFAGINGPAVSKQSVAGKVAVIEFWFTGCGPCQVAFPQLAKVYEKYKNSDRVTFVGVSVDEPQVDDKQIQDTAAAWGANYPIARDSSGQFQSAFEGIATPALFVLGLDGVVQFNEVGLNLELTKDLPATIETLLAGKSTWDDAKSKDHERQVEYARRIQEPSAPFTAVEDLPATKILPRDEPKSLKLTNAWENTEIRSPGNLLVVNDVGGSSNVLVVDGVRTVVELSGDGKTTARHELKIPEQAAISYLRTATDREGHRYFAGSAAAQQQLFLFDADWKQLLSFPAADQGEHAGIGDVQFINLEELATPQLAIGYWGIVGVQMVSLTGTRLKADRTVEFVLGMTETGADSRGLHRLLCTTSRGTIVPVDSTGTAEAEWRLNGIAFDLVGAADAGGGKRAICSLAHNNDGTSLAVGLNDRGEDLWRYILPRGIFRTPIQPLTSAALVGGASSGPQPANWIIAGPDGSIHFVGIDGSPIDHFHFGEALTGLAGARVNGDPLLLIATAKGVSAWRVEAK
jgi:thiol-disulfide isomerase/thioredoxin